MSAGSSENGSRAGTPSRPNSLMLRVSREDTSVEIQSQLAFFPGAVGYTVLERACPRVPREERTKRWRRARPCAPLLLGYDDDGLLAGPRHALRLARQGPLDKLRKFRTRFVDGVGLHRHLGLPFPARRLLFNHTSNIIVSPCKGDLSHNASGCLPARGRGHNQRVRVPWAEHPPKFSYIFAGVSTM